MDSLRLPAWAEQARATLAEVGVQVCGVAAGAPWQHVLPGCRSVLVFGSGGSALWEHLRALPAGETDREHPVDQLVKTTLTRLTVADSRRWVRCADDETTPLDFRTLALNAGLGHRSRLGLLLHPEFGPWWALRAACFTTEPLPLSPPLRSAPPCAGCAAPCADACPVRAPRESGFELQDCLAWQARSESCSGGCLARIHCPEGRSHAYDAAQHRYHHHPASRAALWASALTR